MHLYIFEKLLFLKREHRKIIEYICRCDLSSSFKVQVSHRIRHEVLMIKEVPQKTEKMVISFRDAGGIMTNGAESRTSERSSNSICYRLSKLK